MALTKIPKTLLDTSAGVNLGDNEKLLIGASDDLQIYHDGNNSYITDTGTGDLKIGGANIVITTAGGTKYFEGASNRAFLFHTGNQKLVTTATGIQVTGNVAATTFSGATATASGGTNTTALASTAFVQQELTTLIGGAPSTLNDLNELAAAINDDANYNTTLTTALATKAPLASPAFNSGTGNVVASFTSTDTIAAIQLVDNNGNVEIGAVGNDFHVMNAGGAAKMIVQSDGKVGIGIAPSTKLHLSGTAPGDSIIRQDSTVSGTNWEIGERVAGKWQIFEDDADSIVATFMSSGNVGVGTPSPSARLHVYTTGYPSGKFERYGTSTATRGWTQIGHSALGYSGGTGADSYLVSQNGFGFAVNEGTTALVITDGGKVGIGTTAPNNKLQIGSVGASNYGGNEFVIGDGTRVFATYMNATSDAVEFYTNRKFAFLPSGSGSTGYVGIGTATPDLKLDVSHGTTTEYVATFQNTADNLELKIGTTTGALLNIQGQVISSSAAYNIGLQADGGNVGIGTATPFSKLEVTGMTADAYTNNAFNDKPAITIKHANTSTNYGGIRFTNSSGAYEHFIGGVQTGSRADMVFQGYNAGTAAYQEHMRIKDTGDVGIGELVPLGKLHIKEQDSGQGSVNANFDQLVLEDDSHSGMTILSGTSGDGGIYFGDSGGNNMGQFKYKHSTNAFEFTTNNGAPALTIDSSGLMQGSLSRYTNSSNVNVIMEDAHESAASIGSSWTTLTYWIASQSGELRTTLGLYISSGSYYFNYRFFNVTKNTVVKMSDNSTDASHFYNANQTSNEGNVHYWQYYQLDLGVIDAGDEIKIQMQAATGAGVPAAGNGQIGYIKHWRFLSGKQVPVERDNGVMERPTVRGVMRQSQLQNGTGPVTHTIPIFLGSGTHNIFSILTGFTTGSMAVASIRYVALYAYAGNNSGLGDQQATIRRGTNNTVWSVGNKTVHFETNGGGVSTPAFAWTTGGVLQMIIAGSVQVVGEVTITTYDVPGYKYGVNV